MADVDTRMHHLLGYAMDHLDLDIYLSIYIYHNTMPLYAGSDRALSWPCTGNLLAQGVAIANSRICANA